MDFGGTKYKDLKYIAGLVEFLVCWFNIDLICYTIYCVVIYLAINEINQKYLTWYSTCTRSNERDRAGEFRIDL